MNHFQKNLFQLILHLHIQLLLAYKNKIHIIEKIKIYKNELEKLYINIKKLYNEGEDNIDKYSNIFKESKIK